jgi:hypothetical protein
MDSKGPAGPTVQKDYCSHWANQVPVSFYEKRLFVLVFPEVKIVEMSA